jgi:hypothetical protein
MGSAPENELRKIAAAGPVSRIRRVTLLPCKLLKRNRGELSMMLILAVLAGFASHGVTIPLAGNT